MTTQSQTITKVQVLSMRDDANKKMAAMKVRLDSLTTALEDFEDKTKTAKVSIARIKSDIVNGKKAYLEQKKRVALVDRALSKGNVIIKGVRYFVQ